MRLSTAVLTGWECETRGVAGTTGNLPPRRYVASVPVRRSTYDAIVVGAGPNGLTAAARLTREGRRVLVVEASSTIGGGSRTKSLGPDARYDVCAAVHPFGVSSPAFEHLRLGEHGLSWCHPPIGLAHPFDDGTAAVLRRATSDQPHATADGLGSDGRRWRAAVDPFAADWDRWRHLALGAVVPTVLRHPLAMARFGVVAGLPAVALARLFATKQAKSLIVGMAAHSGVALSQPATAGVAVALAAAGEAAGMPFAAGGSQSIVDTLAAVVREGGGNIETDRVIQRRSELPSSDALLLDLTPGQAASVLGMKQPRWRHGVAAWKLDLVLSAPLPWTAADCRHAGTVHVGGEGSEIARAERATAQGKLVDNPFVIVAQPSVADPSRAPVGQHVVWAYRHVPNGCTADDATGGIERQLDRFAPGWRDLVLHRQVTTAVDYSHYNLSYVGGDIAGGAMTLWQTIARPRLAFDPYRIQGTRVWLCSQSTPPGPGVHGMSGWHAAGSVLADQRRRSATPPVEDA